MPVSKPDRSQALEKIKRYCAYQERAHSEVRTKLETLGVSRSDADEIIVALITDGFLNEERFARAFAGGKFRMKKWGRLRIVQELERKGVTQNCIRAAMKEIDATDYRDSLRKILEQKISVTDHEDPYVRRDRISRYAITKGYEPELVWKELNELLP